MRFKGLIITGTSCAGKSTIAEQLCKEDTIERKFKQAKAVTTRERRDGDTMYEYLSQEQFEKLEKGNKLLVSTSYRDKRYGITKKEYETILCNGEIPILVITPSSSFELLDNHEDLLCFFIDASDGELLARHNKRDGPFKDKQSQEKYEAQVKEDRTFSEAAHYILKNQNIQTSVELIIELWHRQYQGGGLPKRLIEKMINCGMLLDNADVSCIKGASYDLRLGDEYYYGGTIKTLSDKNPFLSIEPYDYAIVSCQESANIPRDIIAKFDLSVGLFCQGIILSNGPQIDPGFRGTLFCLLFNTSNKVVHIKRSQHYATIEFNKLLDYAPAYTGKYQDRKKIIDYIPANALNGAINELKKDIEKLRSENHTMQNIYIGVVAIMFTIISLLLLK